MIKVLSLHFTKKCNKSCQNCYMKNKSGRAKSTSFFLKFPKISKRLGIKQIALGGGEPSLFPDFIEKFGKECKKNKIIANMTTNGYGISEKTMKKYRHLTLISFSIDKFKIHSLEDLNDIFKKMDLAKKYKIKVGCNLQLDTFVIDHLYYFLKEITKHSDYIYLLQPKPSFISMQPNLRTRLLGARYTFKNVFVDDSLKMAMGFSRNCGRGRDIISIDFSGNAYKCSFDNPFAKLEKAEDLIKIVKEGYPFGKTMKCPFI